VQQGRLEIREDDGVYAFGAETDGAANASLRVADPAFWPAIALRGSIGAAEAWRDGAWTSDHLPAVVRLMVRNREVLDGIEGGLARLAAPLQRWFHARHRNTRAGSRRNIAAHYDLGNEFFAAFLDESLTYSCALFERAGMSLEEAQSAKLDRLCRKLDLRPGDHLLEIGTGWGSMALHAARHYGCRVTTTTISREQLAVARERIAAAGLADRVELLAEDYRDLRGRYDKLVAVEMIEAVGADHLDAFLGACGRLLRPDGLLALQAITIQDQHYARAVREVDFIKRYVFPGSFIPCATAICEAATRASDLRLVHYEDLGPHYATTLARWRSRFCANRERIAALGYDVSFQRLWDYYLAYCEGGFAERFLGLGQIVFAKPRATRSPIVASLP
jgi:cyclopropane-fatty-acyl-phospholipid synthase